ncbi:MAG: ABC transporter ATP-binding protein [Methylococcaceae bacterium]|nr:ABC transporter ATP-binding protein [Methylococcaceae bacterium]
MVRDLSFAFNSGKELFRNASISIEHPSITAIVGRSGSGKTTFLRLISGLCDGYQGQIEVFGKMPVEARRERLIGLVQQQAILLRWRTVAENVSLAGEVAGDVRSTQKVNDVCAQVGLCGALNLYPHEISAGMAARVTIARTILLSPRLILLDEPFAHLDELTRRQLENLVRKLHEDEKLSFLLVTHNLDEAVFLSDRVTVLDPAMKQFADDIEVPMGNHRSNEMRYSEAFRTTLIQVYRHFEIE